MHEYERYGSGSYIPIVTTSASTTANFTFSGSYGTYYPPAEPVRPARPKTNRERLADEVDKVCALARK